MTDCRYPIPTVDHFASAEISISYIIWISKYSTSKYGPQNIQLEQKLEETREYVDKTTYCRTLFSKILHFYYDNTVVMKITIYKITDMYTSVHKTSFRHCR